MTERPIIFSGPMVRAILAGTKTQTRRIIKPQPMFSPTNPPSARTTRTGDIFTCPDRFPTEPGPPNLVIAEKTGLGGWHMMGQEAFAQKRCPFGVKGGRLWVREGFVLGWPVENGDIQQYDENGGELPKAVWYRADPDPFYWVGDDGFRTDHVPWKPSIHMPRAASRITLEVCSVRVERLQGIGKADALAEGIQDLSTPESFVYGIPGVVTAQHPVRAFWLLWESVHGIGSWEANPWVWAIEFRRATD